jgi:hypothetical protein
MPTVADNEYAALAAVYGPGLSMQDMRRKKWAGDLKTSMNDLEKTYYPGNDSWSLSEEKYKAMGGDPKNSLSDNSGSYWSGGSVAPPVTVRNIVDRPAPVAISNWASNNAAMWAHTYTAGTISIERLAGATPLYTASVLDTGLITANPVLPAGSQWQRSVEVFSTVPVTVTIAAINGFPTGQVIPANVWTTIRNNFIADGVARYLMCFYLVAASDPGLGVLTQLRHAMLVEDKSVWRTNQAINPGYESGNNCINTADGSRYAITADTVAPIGGTKSALFTRIGPLNTTIAQIIGTNGSIVSKIPVTEGQPITGGLSVKTDQANASVTTRWYWYDSGNTLTAGTPTIRVTGLAANTVIRVVETGTPPSGAVTAWFVVTVITGSGNCVGGEKAWADLLTLEYGTTDGSPLCLTNGLASWTGAVDASTSVVATKQIAYADGGSTGWNWEGTANASPSTGPAYYVKDTLLTFSSQAACDVLYTPAPTIVITAQSTTSIAGAVLTAPTDAKFTYRAAGGYALGTPFPFTTVVAPNSRYNNAYASPSTAGVSFLHTGTEFECMFYLASTSGSLRLRIDGQRVTALPVMSLTANGSRYVWKVTFGSSATRRIDVDSGYNHFGGIFLAAGNTIAAVPALTKRCILFGDSIVNGSASTTGLANGTWKQLFDKYCGIDDIWDAAIGGTGYLARGPGAGVNTENMQAHIADALNWSPKIVIVFAGTNDTAFTDVQVGAAAATLYQSLKTLPVGTEFYVWSTWCPVVTPGASVIARDAALKQAAKDAGFPFWCIYSGDLYGRSGQLLGNIGPMIRNAGDVTTFIQGDLVHPTDAGNTRIAQMGQLAMQLMAPSS